MSSQTRTHHARGHGQAAALAATLQGLPRRVLAAFDRGIAALLLWRQVDHDIRRLSALSDAELRRRGLERGEIVASVYAAARMRRPERN